MRNKILILVTLLLTSACSRYESWDANFIGINRSHSKVLVIIDGIELGALLPTSTANFVTTIVSGKSTYYGTSPSSNRTSTVSVVFKNTASGTVSSPIFCTAGERMKTTIVYDSSYGYDSSNCYSTN